MSIPNYGSLQNNSNQEYRCKHATKLKSTYDQGTCLMKYIKQSDGTYAIQNVDNSQYFDSSITTMSGSVDGPSQQWRLLALPDVTNGYYVQNVENNEFMTSSASKLSSSAGSKEVWIIVEQAD